MPLDEALRGKADGRAHRRRACMERAEISGGIWSLHAARDCYNTFVCDDGCRYVIRSSAAKQCEEI